MSDDQNLNLGPENEDPRGHFKFSRDLIENPELFNADELDLLQESAAKLTLEQCKDDADLFYDLSTEAIYTLAEIDFPEVAVILGDSLEEVLNFETEPQDVNLYELILLENTFLNFQDLLNQSQAPLSYETIKKLYCRLTCGVDLFSKIRDFDFSQAKNYYLSDFIEYLGSENVKDDLKFASQKANELQNPFNRAFYIFLSIIAIRPCDEANTALAFSFASISLMRDGIRPILPNSFFCDEDDECVGDCYNAACEEFFTNQNVASLKDLFINFFVAITDDLDE